MATKSPTAKSNPKAAAKSAPALKVVAEEGAPATEAKPVAAGLKLKELVDRVTQASDVKKKDVKSVVEATLAEVGKALARGEPLNLPGLGRLRVARTGPEGSGSMVLKLRQPTPGGAKAKTAKEPLAEGDE